MVKWVNGANAKRGLRDGLKLGRISKHGKMGPNVLSGFGWVYTAKMGKTGKTGKLGKVEKNG